MRFVRESLALGFDQMGAWTLLRRDRRAVQEFQLRMLRELVAHAAAEVPYYSRLLAKAKIQPEIENLEEFRGIPVSEKSDLQSCAMEDRFARSVDRKTCRFHETSGSTGERIVTARTPAEESRLFGRRLRAQVLAGLRPWHQRLVLGAPPRRFFAHRVGAFRTAGVDLSRSLVEMMDEAERVGADVIKGPPGTLERIAEEHPQRLAGLRLEMILTGAEQLSPGARSLINRTADCPVIDSYGSVECNLIAFECRRCGLYHTCDDSVFVETLRPDGSSAEPGEEGDVVVTALLSRAMPFVRYRIGDRVRLPRTTPECEIPFGAIERISGRSVDHLRFEGGLRLSPYQVMDELDEITEVRRYFVIQESARSVSVQYEARGAGDGLPELIRRQLARVLPAGVEIEPRRVERIVTPPDQKRRFVQAWTKEGH